MWKKILALVTAVMAMMAIAACSMGGSTSASAGSTASSPTVPKDGKTLVVYFSGTGNTKRAAEIIASESGADIYSITPEKPYTKEDLNYRNKESRVVKERDQPGLRPALAGDVPDWDKYETVYLGYPLWSRQAPPVVYSFVESHNFEGKTVIPFCTSTLDPIGTSGENLAKAAGSGNWLEGDRFSERESEKEIRNWVDSLKK